MIRPVALKGNVMYQAEEFTEKQAFHRNLSAGEAKEYIAGQLSSRFKQGRFPRPWEPDACWWERRGT